MASLAHNLALHVIDASKSDPLCSMHKEATMGLVYCGTTKVYS